MVDHDMELNSEYQAPKSKPLEFISAYHAGMAWHDRLNMAFQEKGWKKAELARRADVPYDSLTKYLAGAVKQPRGDILDKLAHALELDPLFLKEGVEGIDAMDASIPLMGYVGAGAEVLPEFEQVPEDGLDQVSLPFPVPAEMIAFKVRGDSMLPQFKSGTVLIVYREQQRALETFFGEEAVVRTSDGRRFIKTIIRGQRGVNLISWNAEPIEDVRLDWIGQIFAVLPPTAAAAVPRKGGIQGQLALKRSA